MDREFRKQQMDSVNQKAVAKIKRGHHMEREYTLQEIAIVTRAGPARILGLKNKGHLGPGADADITIYDEHEDKELMFSAPRYVLKSGHLIIDNHEFRNNHEGKILHVAPGYDEGIKDVIRPFVEDFYTIKFDNYAVSDHYIPRHEVVPTAKQ
ncbi:MAG TPA: formylmethanofuran dehydrogenase subunit A, partial [Rhodospirillaceae bacterium]|nr:formylmethanofuran dehydrogenase subunit A [Rhodospirillaceae bacterium]